MSGKGRRCGAGSLTASPHRPDKRPAPRALGQEQQPERQSESPLPAGCQLRTLRWKTIAHRLNVGITVKVAQYVNVGLNAIALYDDDQDNDNDIQFSQGMTIGVAYTGQHFTQIRAGLEQR